MKIHQTFQVVAALILMMGSVTGQSQIQAYYYSGPVIGYTEVDLTPSSGYSGGFSVTFGTLTEILYYDPVTQTVTNEVGSLSFSPASGSFDIVRFSPWPQAVVGSANLTVGDNGSFSFNRTPAPSIFGNPSRSSILHVPVVGYGSYEGQAFSGSWNIDISLNLTVDAVSSESLTFSELAGNSAYGLGASGGYVVIPGIGPTGGLKNGTDDGTYYYRWQLDHVEATAVPEPNSIALSGLGLLALTLLRRRLP